MLFHKVNARRAGGSFNTGLFNQRRHYVGHMHGHIPYVVMLLACLVMIYDIYLIRYCHATMTNKSEICKNYFCNHIYNDSRSK